MRSVSQSAVLIVLLVEFLSFYSQHSHYSMYYSRSPSACLVRRTDRPVIGTISCQLSIFGEGHVIYICVVSINAMGGGVLLSEEWMLVGTCRSM